MPYTSPWAPLEIPRCNILSYLFPSSLAPSEKPLWIDAVDTSNSISPAQMLFWIKRFAVGLDRLGVPQQEVVLVFSPNHIFVPLVYLATAGSKRYFTGANPAYTIMEVAHQMQAVEPAVVLVHPSLLDTAVAAAKQADIPLDRFFLFSDTNILETTTTSGLQDWRSFVASEADAKTWQWDPLEGDLATQTTAVVNFSSGTTGLPKGVCITHYNLVANSAQAIFSDYAGPKTTHPSSERWLAFLPLYHAYSQLFTINIALKLRISAVYIMSKFIFENYLKYIQRFKITTVQLVPPVLVMMAKRSETARYDISSTKHILSGAAPLSSDLQNEVMTRFGMVVCQGWGMTETTCSGIMTPGTTKDLSGSIGFLLPNTEARLVQENGDETVHGEAGELWLRGPQIMLEYWRNNPATLETKTTDGWFKTGDVAATEGGKWWIVDRKKELIKVNGLQVAPAELEAVLLEHQDVADAAAVAITTVDGNELPRAYVMLQAGARERVTAKDIQAFVAEKLSKHKHLTGGVKFVDEVPKLASGKIVRKVLKDWAKRDAVELGVALKARL
ncbi:hypothetical protein LTR10_016174 [Elasticomyces elasticus]|uniref:4-coumarate-CoA ligase n=1 Tax=Exophiala sideris TaxID=1016849 RepID=A0ABR0JEH5_9EURO|nr:hypothetical protein LTR10_016174 [Elasticomyces elasticus]KAK5027620.1 hypothetical protein LTR13_009553 [Exophiala sideris]KAK5032817.1 hypothetical protein LTS07_004227 [Exophiala sideris]KAK5062341.1 hypothetical protein LTR69_004699 [Exophiala sideris]KAK5177499.1 hypothetical protein LTR44_009909 [Eurotiomycetes sp. CCFEE 6388]